MYIPNPYDSSAHNASKASRNIKKNTQNKSYTKIMRSKTKECSDEPLPAGRFSSMRTHHYSTSNSTLSEENLLSARAILNGILAVTSSSHRTGTLRTLGAKPNHALRAVQAREVRERTRVRSRAHTDTPRYRWLWCCLRDRATIQRVCSHWPSSPSFSREETVQRVSRCVPPVRPCVCECVFFL